MDNIVQLDSLRIEWHNKRKCVCEVKRYVIDKVNREIKCGCGILHDPFEALLDIASGHERINEQHKNLKAQAEQWKKEKPYSVLFKELERGYQRGVMFPYCPSCDGLFDFKDISAWGNADFYRRLKARSEGHQSTE